jgi:hypothetical protein
MRKLELLSLGFEGEVPYEPGMDGPCFSDVFG